MSDDAWNAEDLVGGDAGESEWVQEPDYGGVGEAVGEWLGGEAGDSEWEWEQGDGGIGEAVGEWVEE